MTLNELNYYYTSLISNITTDEETINRTGLLDYVLPSLNASRLTDSDEIEYSYYRLEQENVEIDGYTFNESGERLQIFLSNLLLPGQGEMHISRKDYYDAFFLKAKNFVTRSIKGYLKEIQESDPAAVLIRFLENSQSIKQIDVIEIFLISNTISIEPRGQQQSPKTFQFNDDDITIKITEGNSSKQKSISIKYQLIDLNRIYSYEISEGNSEPIVITFDPPLQAIKAADDMKVFESYLAVIPAVKLVEFYKNYSSRLLERNVRSFLSFKGANQEMKKTLQENPEKFIAYNNGLTITSTTSEIDYENGISMIKSLTDFQIVNGGQTTASIYFSSKEGVDISKVNVTAKINIVKSENREDLDELISNISKYSNSQSKVSSVDLNSRSTHLVRIKKLSESITDPSGKKWFFERVRGEFNTLLRINPKQKIQIEKSYPRSKRLSKEQLAKYFVAWGNKPHLVRKGGEKVFRDFMSFIQLDHNGKALAPENLDRRFYEDMIGKAIIFKELEIIYGSGPNAIGQIRSTVVPYAISIIYTISCVRKVNRFDLGRIWTAQMLPADLKAFCTYLLKAVHEWCKRYSKSDDVGEYAKKEELWKDILDSPEFKQLKEQPETKNLLDHYLLNDQAYNKRYQITELFDFSQTMENGRIHSNGEMFYNNIRLKFDRDLSTHEKNRFQQIVQKIQVKHNIEKGLIEFEKEKVKKLQEENADWFLNISTDPSGNLFEAVNSIINIYTKNANRFKEAFEAETVKALNKGLPQQKAIAFKNIGISISKNEEPLIADIYKISDCLNPV